MIQNDYSALFRPAFWFGNTDVQFELCDTPPEDRLISNVNIIGYSGDRWLVLRVDNAYFEIPGGTREPDELLSETIQRELREEAGAALKNWRPVGAWRCTCHAEAPFRAHMPHPLFYRLVVMGEVELVGRPTNPPGAEQVTSVEFVPLDEAVRRFLNEGRTDIADLFRLAASLR